MPFTKTPLNNLLIFEPTVYQDSRGYFFEAYSKKTFLQQGLNIDFLQDNQSQSEYGVIRGLHYQLNPHAQTKLVRVLHGTIYDVAVDIRQNSATYGQWFGIELSAENKKQLLVPQGFAHGFSVLSPTATVLYKVDSLYNKEAEGGICFNDATLNINWQINTAQAIVSDKDIVLPTLANIQHNFVYNG
jgi:dTDP-4-dehydrorhamnose 3,5-epimerase